MHERLVILVVDDNTQERQYYHRVLEWAGYEVTSAPDGEAALALLRSRSFGLVVADIKMPRLDGYELLVIARNDPQIKAVPFLFVTAYHPGSSVRRYGVQLGAGPHITKPVEPDVLVQAVKRTLANPRVTSDVLSSLAELAD